MRTTATRRTRLRAALQWEASAPLRREMATFWQTRTAARSESPAKVIELHAFRASRSTARD